MIDWNLFQEKALKSLTESSASDEELNEILRDSTWPGNRTDVYGCPLPGNAVAFEHPSPREFVRAIEVRMSIADQSGDSTYVAYAKRIIEFFETLSVEDAVHIVNIRTGSKTYEMVYSPSVANLFIAAFPQ